MNRTRPIIHSLLFAAGLAASALWTASAAQAEPKGPHVLQIRLSPSGSTPAAWGKAKFRSVRQYSRFTVETHGLVPGAYDILIGGGVVGSLEVGIDESADAGSRFTLDSRLASGLLFDPRGTSVEVVNRASGVTELSTNEFPADKAAERSRIEITADFANTGVQPAAIGSAELESFKGRSRLLLKLEGLAPGMYDVLVGDTSGGRVTVASLDQFDVSFDSLPTAGADDPADESLREDRGRGHSAGSLLLTFDPRGLPLSLSLAGQSVLLLDPFPEN